MSALEKLEAEPYNPDNVLLNAILELKERLEDLSDKVYYPEGIDE